MEAIQITLSAIVALFGLLLSISVPKQKNKRRLRISAIVLCMGFLVSQIVILEGDSREKQAQQQEFLRLKYSLVLDDNKILQTVHSFAIAKNNTLSMSIYLSPTRSATM
jgi:NADH:ubiquinone oxidoreductase subunit 4 (subunit M)